MSSPTAASPPAAIRGSPSPSLERLRLSDFRNFSRLDWRPPAGRLLLLGPNGVGKSTLLEAVYLAATSRSFRTARLEVCARRGGEGFEVGVEVGRRPTRELAVAWRGEPRSERVRTLDGRPATLAEHLAVLPVVAHSQADAELLTGGPELRRRWLDRGLVHRRATLLDALARYRRALDEKRALLGRGGRGGAVDRRALEPWNALLARFGAELARARAELVEELDGELRALRAAHAPGLPSIGLRYRPGSAAALEGEAALADALERSAPTELARRRPLLGPHRDEFELDWDGAPARHAASSGERKLAGLLLAAALGRRLAAAGRSPALLVDDADAELDRARLRVAVAAFGGFETLLVTSSRPQAWEGVPELVRVAVGAPDSGLPAGVVERLVGGGGSGP